MNTIAIIQARMGSNRLPGKVMKILGDRSVLGHVIKRCLAIPSVNQVVVATSNLEEDTIICQEAERYGVSYYRGSQENVLSRYYEAAKENGAENIVRITSDCPLLDPNISESVISHFLDNNFDYSSSGLSGTFPRGLDTEVFTFYALERCYLEATIEYEHEHVTPYIYQHPEFFNFYKYYNSEDDSRYRLTLDTPEDWKLIQLIYKELYKGEIFYWEEIRQLLKNRPELMMINEGVKQKILGE
ncbi:glycosyltransferase family protein [Paenibacillus sp. ClWae2A]|uniref:glycosyltransferase family protein n=1 Tax=Paenibacillus sp. ClWae2A TaxID=3057177 RepID=UPI0028F63A4E|nr:glycosyltransferase family protein [Paenibacillus sp. ClWae2A]MDT9720516.1 glycosyltransferase family protein [Paenibacillus sp. ClWae2A]